MGEVYQILGKKDSRELAEFLMANGQALVPMVELISEARMALDEFVGVLGGACLEAVLGLSAQQACGERSRTMAGSKHPGRVGGEVRYHGRQSGTVRLATQKVRVSKPRLRKKSGGKHAEVAVPAYEAMRDDSRLSEKLAGILMSGVSTRNPVVSAVEPYERVVPEMAASCGISRSSISRQFAAASAEQLRALCERRFDDVDLLIVYIDGVQFAEHHVIASVGVDSGGCKHVLGLAEGATENAVVVKALLEDLVVRGVDPGRRRLFVIDGSKALRKAIDAVFGTDHPVQRCRKHKIDNVAGYLPKDLAKQVTTVMRAAYKLDADAGIAKFKQQAKWLEREYPSAAASLLEGLEETFTINRLGLPPALCRCLATTNPVLSEVEGIVESPTSGMRLKTGRVTNWKDGQMVLRWAAAAYGSTSLTTGLDTEKHFRRILGYQHLWTLQAALDADRIKEQGAVA